jgi:hypothetical protein
MKIVLTTDLVYGYGSVGRRGQTVDFPPDDAIRLIQSGQAEAFVEVYETAMDEPRSELRINRRKSHGTPVK